MKVDFLSFTFLIFQLDPYKLPPILQDFVPYRGRCPASPHETKEKVEQAVPDPHRGRKGTCLGPRTSGGPAGPLGTLCSIEVLKRKRKKGQTKKREN